jgi:oligopeptide/dipeptide ABC transporter ATP-binding protein
VTQTLVEAKNLKKYFPIKEGLLKIEKFVKAVDDVSFQVRRGETLGVVGESGCGKSTVARCLLRLIEPTDGEITYQFEESGSIDLLKARRRELHELRRHMQIVFQDPFSSLNPRMLIKDLVAEPLRTFKAASGLELLRTVRRLLQFVGLGDEHLYRYPHEMSGGQLQRVCVARAIALEPEFLILDEPTSALDVSVQAQILNLLKRLQKDLGMTYLFITHNLKVVDFMADRIAVMYLGKIVEVAQRGELFGKPMHPYSQALLSAIPAAHPDAKRLEKAIELVGDVPEPINPPLGCPFHPRCPSVFDQCGFEGRDLLAYFDSNLDTETMRRLAVRARDMNISIAAKDPRSPEALQTAQTLIDNGRKLGQPMFSAIESVNEERRGEVTVIFRPAVQPLLQSAGHDHEVSCFLYHPPSASSGALRH